MIAFDTAHIEISLAVATALLRFASKDATRPIGVGVHRGALCATDGHRLVAFDLDGTKPGARQYAERYHGKRWARSYIETLLKVAKAKKEPTLKLELAQQQDGFPTVSQVIPSYALEPSKATDRIGVNPEYLADLAPVAKACEAAAVQLASVQGELDPIGFYVRGTDLQARVVIMPMRK